MRRYLHIFFITLVLIALVLTSIIPPQAVSASPLLAPSIVSTLTDTIIGDDGDNKADPDETIEYTTVITNSGADPATGVTFQDIIDLNTTFVGGSVNVSPLAGDDSYGAIGNTLLEVGVTASGNPAVQVTNAAIDSLFDNDTEFLGDSFALKSVEAVTAAPFTTATESGGSVTVESDGNFSYTPPLGFSGADHFDYVITDDGPDNILGNADDLIGAGRVTINVNAQRVWYVKNDAAAGGLGRSADPFDTLIEAQNASAANDTIYVFTGNGSATGQNAGIILKSGQRLLGNGVALEIPVGLVHQGIGGPNPTSLRVAGTRPLIGNAAGDGVTLSTVNIGGSFSSVEIRGLSISGTGAGTNAVDVTTHSTFSGSFELADNVISAAGVEGVDVNGGGSGALTASIHDNNVTATGNGIDIARTAGSVTVTAFDDNTVTGATGGIGINVNGGASTVTFDATPGGTFQTVSGSSTAIGTSVDGVGTSGMVLTAVAGDLSFTDLDIVASNGTGFSASGLTAYTGSAGFQIAVGSGATVGATGGPAVNLSTLTASLPFSDIDSSSSTTTGVSLTSVLGTFSAGSGSSITNPAGTAFNVNGGSVTSTYSGSITQNNAQRVVNIDGTTANTITFNTGTITGGASSTGININNANGNVSFANLTLGTSGSRITNQAVTITNGTGAYSLGAVSIFTNNVQGIVATNANGTLNSTSGTVDAGNGTAINIDGPAGLTTLGMTLTRVDSDDAGGSATGIIIQDTNGSFIVNGDGSNTTRGGNSSGGIIAGKSGSDGSTSTGNGVYLNNASGVTLRRMTINGTNQNHGIRGVNSSNFTLEYSTVSGTNGTDAASDEGSVNFDNLTGSAAITGCIIEGGYEDNLNVVNTSGTLDRLVMTNSTFGFNSTANGNNNILLESLNSGTILRYTLQSSLIRGSRSDWLNAQPASGGTMDAIIGGNTPALGNTFSNISPDNHPAPVANGNRILLQANGTSTFNVSNNIVKGSLGSAIATNSLSATASMNGTIQSNTIGVAATANSGSTSASGISIQSTAGGDVTLLIDNNDIFQYNNHGILFTLGDQMGTPPTINVTVTNNVVNTPGNLLTNFNGFSLNHGTVSTDSFTSCFDIHDNNFTSSGSGVTPPNNDNIRLRQRQGTTVQLPGYTGPARDNGDNVVTEVMTYLTGRPNSFTTGTANSVSTGGGYTNTPGGATCTQPIAMLSIYTIAQAQPDASTVALVQSQSETNPIVIAQEPNTNLSTANTLAVASVSMKASKQVSASAPADTVINASTNLGSGKPLFRFIQPRPAQSGETVNVTIGTLPAGKSVTIKFQVTVNNPTTVGAARILNQGTVSGSNFSNVLTTNGGSVDCETGSETCTPVDRPDTTVTSINRSVPASTPTNASSVTWAVTFADPIDGLTASNFTLVNVGLTGSPAITGVSPLSGPTNTWMVTASTGTGQGTLNLTMTSDAGLSHDVTNGNTGTPFTTGQIYNIDHIAPTTISFTRFNPGSSPTNADTLIFHATFSEQVTGVAAIDFASTGTSTAVDSITGGGGIVFGVIIDGTDGTPGDLANLNGAVGLDFSPGVTITDLAGNALANTEPGTDETYTLDNTAPTVTINQAVGQNDPTNANPIIFTAVFSEAVTDFDDLSDVTLSGTASATVTSITGGPTTYTVNVTATTEGTVTATVPVNTAQDSAGNNNAASTSTDNTVTYDTTAPTVTINQAVGQNDPTNANPIVFTAVFNEAVTDFDDLSDVTLGGTASATVTSITGGPTTYTVSVTATTNGTVTATVPVNKAQDSAGNNNAASASTDNTVTYDAAQPTVTINQAGTQSDPTGTSPVNFTVVFSESVGTSFVTGDVNLSASTAAGTLTGTVTEVAPNDGTTYNVAVSGMTGDGFVVASISAGVATDGLNTNAASTSTDNSVLYDTVNPSVTINQAVTQSDPTNANPINFTAVFNEPVTDFDDLTDVTLTGIASATVTSITEISPMNGTTYTVAVTATTDGTVIATIPSAVAQDLGGRDNTASTSTDNTVTYDATAPDVTIDQASGQVDPTGTSPINFTVVFSEAVTGFDNAADVTLSGTAGATTAVVTEIAPNDGTTYTVAVSGMTNGGTVIANISAGGAQDLASNFNFASTSTDNTVTFTVNTTTTITSDNPDPSTVGQAVTVNFTVTATVGPNPSTGNVTVTDSGGATPCVGAVTAGAGSCNITLTTTGAHTLTATYAASGTFNGSNDTESHSVSTTIAVNTFTDELNSNGNCSLREAVRAANTNAAVDACPAGSASIVDIITLATGTYNLTVGGTDNAAVNGDLDITGDTRITGAGAASTFISGLNLPSPGDRIFHILSGTVQIESLTIKNGKNAIGAGVYNAGTLTLNSVTVSDNVATTGANGTSSGAGIYSTGTLTLNNSTVSNNLATSGYKGASLGAGIHNNGATVTLNSSTVTGNRAMSGIQGTSRGGGIYTTGGSTTLNSTTPSGNTVTTGSGGIAQGPNTYP